MKLIVGLGNPGPKYEVTRHNAGFIMVDFLAEHFSANWQGQKYSAEVAKGEAFGHPSFFIKPQTYMNLSGRSVSQFARFYKIKPNDIIVVHDDIDLDFGKVKARVGGGHGGHNGIRSIAADIGSKEFLRIKLGVGRPKEQSQEVADWVLAPMADSELLSIEQSMLQEVLVRIKGMIEGS